MSVLKNLRKLSELEFYKNAIDIRKEIYMWMLKNFNTKRNAKNVERTIKDISKEDKAVIDEIFAKYGRSKNNEFQTEFPKWFVNFERKYLSDLLRDLILHITKANFKYPTIDKEWQKRRIHQNEAISNCYCIYQELQHMISLFPIDLNKITAILDKIEREVDLLSGWQKSDNKRRKKGEA